MSTLANPHDAFCKYVLGRAEQASAFLTHYLPGDLVAPLNLSTLAPLPGSFVDPVLANHHSDLLFSVAGKDDAPNAGPTLVYVLFEHKSEPERKTPLQLLRYMERIWDAHLKDGGRFPLPPILPIVVYQGTTPWLHSPDFAPLVATRPGYDAFVPKFAFHLVDLSCINDADLPADPFLGVGILIMKHVQRPDLPDAIEAAGVHFAVLRLRPTGLEFLKTVLTYIFNNAPVQRRKDVWTALEHVVQPKGDNDMQTIAESWIEEGYVKGMIEGINEGLSKGENRGRAEGLQALIDVIVEDLELSFGNISQTLVASLHAVGSFDELKALRRKLRDATSVEDCERIVASQTRQ